MCEIHVEKGGGGGGGSCFESRPLYGKGRLMVLVLRKLYHGCSLTVSVR